MNHHLLARLALKTASVFAAAYGAARVRDCEKIIH